FGILGIAVFSLAAAVAVTFLSTGLANRRALWTALTVAVIGIGLYMPLQNLFWYVEMSWLWMLLLLVVAVGVGLAVGAAFRGPDPMVSGRTGAITAVVISVLVFIDRVFAEWGRYGDHPAINQRPIATIGARTPNLTGNFWFENLASCTPGSRVEVRNQDYIRPAKATVLPSRAVVMRHALRNALLPLASVVPVDIITMIGGAVITETIFGWSGMGKLFIDSMNRNELD